jgi:hypothetical protein
MWGTVLLRAFIDVCAGLLHPEPRIQPRFGVEYELGGGAAVWAGNKFNLRHKFRLSRGLGIEARGFHLLCL